MLNPSSKYTSKLIQTNESLNPGKLIASPRYKIQSILDTLSHNKNAQSGKLSPKNVFVKDKSAVLIVRLELVSYLEGTPVGAYHQTRLQCPALDFVSRV